MNAHQPSPLPDHVPPSLVRPYPFIFGGMTDKHPFDDLVPEIHRGPPVFWAENAYPGGVSAWVVRRNEDMKAIYLDTDHFSNKDFAPFAKLIGETWSELPAETDPPMHGLYRVFVNPIFTPKALAKLNDRITQYAREYILAFRDKGACEFMGDFAFEFPIKVFLELMGLPLDLTKQFLKWEFALLHSDNIADVVTATRSVVDYLRGEIEDRMVNPTDDLITYGVQAEIEGRIDRRLHPEHADAIAIVAHRPARNVRHLAAPARRDGDHVGEGEKLDIGHDPDRDARAVGKAEIRSPVDRTIGEGAIGGGLHRAVSAFAMAPRDWTTSATVITSAYL